MEADKKPFILNPDRLAYLANEPKALSYFQNLPKSYVKLF